MAKQPITKERLEELFSTTCEEGFPKRPGHVNVCFVSEGKEDTLRPLGFDFPTRKQPDGPITYKGTVVGHADSFNGLTFDRRAEDALLDHSADFERIGFWYVAGGRQYTE